MTSDVARRRGRSGTRRPGRHSSGRGVVSPAHVDVDVVVLDEVASALSTNIGDDVRRSSKACSLRHT
ncbi:hypothetical protein Taro_018541 [Colocasia esculenta]|uniref:Uncharacterized protein n=1 Tax=Colocasia esculenta TaxID=4460 RepID=A0A843V2R9_COLES|nr:hypothetical protein [Colocasia esculenta]